MHTKLLISKPQSKSGERLETFHFPEEISLLPKNVSLKVKISIVYYCCLAVVAIESVYLEYHRWLSKQEN